MRAMGGLAEEDDFGFFAPFDEGVVVGGFTEQGLRATADCFDIRCHATSVA